MQTKRHLPALTLAFGAAALASSCALIPMRVSLAELSNPAQSTVKRVTAGGQIEKIHKEVEKGKSVYDVEATVGGQHLEYLIAESDGAILGTEVPIDFSELPEPVRLAAEKYFGSTSGLTALKGIEYGKTEYEIEGMKGGRKAEVTFDPTGKRLGAGRLPRWGN